MSERDDIRAYIWNGTADLRNYIGRGVTSQQYADICNWHAGTVGRIGNSVITVGFALRQARADLTARHKAWRDRYDRDHGIGRGCNVCGLDAYGLHIAPCPNYR